MKLEPIIEAIENVRAAGESIDLWQVHGTESRRLSLGIKDREAGNAHAPLSLAEGSSARYLLVWSDGLVCRGTLERHQDPETAFVESRATAYEDPDAAHVLGPAEFADVALWDESTAAIAGGETALFAERLGRVRAAIDASGVRTWSGSFSAGASDSRMMTSAGLDVTSRGTSCGWFVSVDGEAGEGFGARRPESEEDFDARLAQLMRTAAQVSQDGQAPPPGTHHVLLHPRVVESYVLSTVMQNLDGSAVAHEESAFKLADFGSHAARLRADVGLSIDPLQPYKAGAYRFTGFGLPAAPCTFIEQGKLVQPILDVKYARRLDLKPTPIPFGPDAASFGTTDRLAYGEALKQADLMVLSVLGVHTQDGISGDFSLSAPMTLAIRQGHPAGRIRGTISGNLWEVLNSAELRFVDVPHESTPGMLMALRFDAK